MSKQSQFLAQIPFSGFYNTWHSDAIDQEALRTFEDYQTGCIESAPEHLTDTIWWHVDFQHVQTEYVKAYAESFCDEFDLQGEFESMDSPREYNFETDRVFIYLTRDSLASAYRRVDKSTLDQVANDRHTHRSGFVSHYSPDWRSWGLLSTWDHNQLCTLLIALAETETGKDFGHYEEFDLVQDLSGNGYLSNWIFENAGEPFIKAARLWDRYQRMLERKRAREWQSC